jgi:hypothetical protein
MNLKRTATIVVVGGAAAAWLSAAMTPNERQSAASKLLAPPIGTAGVELASEISRLHERLHPDAMPSPAARNLFRFRSTNPRPAPAVAESHARADAVATSNMVPELPLRLVGIAEDSGSNGPVRTAIISGNGQLFLVKEGEHVTPRYQVAAISSDVVELKDLAGDAVRRLSLK